MWSPNKSEEIKGILISHDSTCLIIECDNPRKSLADSEFLPTEVWLTIESAAYSYFSNVDIRRLEGIIIRKDFWFLPKGYSKYFLCSPNYIPFD